MCKNLPKTSHHNVTYPISKWPEKAFNHSTAIQQCIVQWVFSFSDKKEHCKDSKKDGACLCLHTLRMNISYMQMKKSFGLCET